MALETELAYFNRKKDDFLREHAGKYLLIKGEELSGAFATEAQAYEAGLKQFGNQPFLIKRAAEEPTTKHAERMMWRPSAFDEAACEYVRGDLFDELRGKLAASETRLDRIQAALLAWDATAPVVTNAPTSQLIRTIRAVIEKP